METKMGLATEQQARHEELSRVCAAAGLSVDGPSEWDRRSHQRVDYCYSVATLDSKGELLGWFNQTDVVADFVLNGNGTALQVVAFLWLEIGRIEGQQRARNPIWKSPLPVIPKALTPAPAPNRWVFAI